MLDNARAGTDPEAARVESGEIKSNGIERLEYWCALCYKKSEKDRDAMKAA